MTVYGDGGGKAPSVPVPLVGAERVAKALIGWGRLAWSRGLAHRPALVNGEPGIVFHGPDGRVAWVAGLEIADGVVVAVRSILNPRQGRAHPVPLKSLRLLRCGQSGGRGGSDREFVGQRAGRMLDYGS